MTVRVGVQRKVEASIRAVLAALVMGIISHATPACAHGAEAYVFAISLRGDPEVGCSVTTDDDGCGGDLVQGDALAEGTPAFSGRFAFTLSGRPATDSGLLGGRGRAVLRGSLIPFPGAPSIACRLRGRVRTRGVSLPVGDGAARIYTGTFDARGVCDGQPARVRAIWSGSIGSIDDAVVTDFERFSGRLAGTVRIGARHGGVGYRLPTAH
jgi:hypothetical protein